MRRHDEHPTRSDPRASGARRTRPAPSDPEARAGEGFDRGTKTAPEAAEPAQGEVAPPAAEGGTRGMAPGAGDARRSGSPPGRGGGSYDESGDFGDRTRERAGEGRATRPSDSEPTGPAGRSRRRRTEPSGAAARSRAPESDD